MSFILDNFYGVFGDYLPDMPDQTNHEDAFEEKL